MPKIIYKCDACQFLFERTGKIEDCPDCGRDGVRVATNDEQSEYMKIRAELQKYDD